MMAACCVYVRTFFLSLNACVCVLWADCSSKSVRMPHVQAPVLLEGWEGNSTQVVISCSRLWLWTKGASPATDCSSFIITHAVLQTEDLSTPAVHGSSYLWSWHGHVVPELPHPLRWKAVLKMAHIYPLNVGTIDWRIRPDSASDAGWGIAKFRCKMDTCWFPFNATGAVVLPLL